MTFSASGAATASGSTTPDLTGQAISDVLVDLLGQPLAGATILAFPADQLADPPLVDASGNALSPTTEPVANTMTAGDGSYTLPGLLGGEPYHLYVIPPTLPPYWVYDVTPSNPLLGYCTLSGTVINETGAPVQAVIEVWPELAVTLPDGTVIPEGDAWATASDALGAWSLDLWPTAFFAPPVPYRVRVGSTLWRGTLPAQDALDFAAWTALPTTSQLA